MSINVAVVSLAKEDTGLTNLLENHAYYVQLIQEETQLIKSDVFVIEMDEATTVPSVLDWLLKKDQVSPLFTYIVSKPLPENERNVYLQLGVNAVIEKTKTMLELLYVIENNLKSVQTNEKNSQKHVSSNECQLKLNPNKFSVLIDESEVLLTRLEYQLFQRLYETPNDTVTYQELYESLWEEYSEENPYRIANLVFHIRSKLDTKKSGLIQTIRNKGYLLNLQ